MKRELSHTRLLAFLKYEPETGEFIWRVRRDTDSPAGARAGARGGRGGYRSITIDGRKYLESRLAHFYVTGAWPLGQVDHRDGDVVNNRWLNLRVASPSQNSANRGPTRKNKSGFKGVSPHVDGKWIATICVNYEKKYLGLHETKEQAAAAYAAAATAYFGEFARTVKGERAARRGTSAATPPATTEL